MKTFDIDVFFTADDPPPPDRSLVIGWRSEFPTAHLLEYRKSKNAFYSDECPLTVDAYVFLADLVGDKGVQAIRERWDWRDGRKTPKTCTQRRKRR